MYKKIKISPSILSADFANLKSEVCQVVAAGADYIHIDIMDGCFVPSITIGPCVIKAIRKYCNILFDVHIMAKITDRIIDDCIAAGADIITVHIEAVTHMNSVISKIKSHGKKVGVAIVPSTPLSVLEYVLADIDLLLIMTVNPGAAGQVFIESQFKKIEAAKNLIKKYGLNTEISVDGGINHAIAPKVIKAGADVLVAGTAIFGNEKSYELNINKLRGIDESKI